MAAKGEKDLLAVADACQAVALDLGSWLDALAGVATLTGSRSGELIQLTIHAWRQVYAHQLWSC